MGPCLCGDPYCSSCGDPSQAYLEECIEGLMDKVGEFIESPIEAGIIWKAGKVAVLKARELVDDAVAQVSHNHAMERDYLKDRIEELEHKVLQLQNPLLNGTKSSVKTILDEEE